jgi:hypothetical protein
MTNCGNKTQGGGSEVSTDGSSITIDGVTTPITASDPTVGGTKLKRVDTNAYEVPQTGVEYYAPPPYSYYGTKSRARRFTGSGTGAKIVLIASGIARPIGCIGSCFEDNVDQHCTPGWPDAGYTFAIGSETATGNLTLQRGSALSNEAGDTYDIIAFYVVV